MIKSDAKLKNLYSVFNGKNKKLITEAIELLRDVQPFEGAIGLLVSLYDRSTEDEIKSAVESFMNDLKFQSAVPEVISEIRKDLKPQTTRMLVSSCWQSGLNYSLFPSEFADVFIKGDYLTAVECLTVIEEFVQELTGFEKEEMIRKMNLNLLPEGDEKTALTRELISILSR